MQSSTLLRATIWNEFVHERQSPAIAEIYPRGIHGTLAEMLEKHEDLQVRTTTLDEPEQGLPQDERMCCCGRVIRRTTR